MTTTLRKIPAVTAEGTSILSTGEVGGTKFLREDGDGTSSWQTSGGGSLTLVASGTFTNTLSPFDITSISSANMHVLKIKAMAIGGDGDITITLNNDSGTNYTWYRMINAGNGSATAQTFITAMKAKQNEYAQAEMKIPSGSNTKHISNDSFVYDGTNFIKYMGGSHAGSATAVSRITASAGQQVTGTYALYEVEDV